MKKKTSLYLLSVLLLFLSGCLGTKFLKEDQNLLYKQKLEGATDLDTEMLESFYQTKPNKRLPLLRFAPYVYVYQGGKKKYDKQDYNQKRQDIEDYYTEKIDTLSLSDSKIQSLKAKKNKKLAQIDKTIKEGNLMMRWGEPLSIFDSAATEKTTEQLAKYLRSIGFFNASASYKKKVAGRKIEITYVLDPKESYTIDSLLFDVADIKIDSLIKAKDTDNLLKRGNRYDQSVLTAERGRLYELMSNNGYYDFSRQYISFEVDSSSLPNRGVIIKTIILNPPNANKHKVFTLDSVFFTTDSDIKGLTAQRFREDFNGVIYRYYFKQYSKKIIDWRLFLYPGDLYSKEKTFETQRQLSNLDIYKFINIKYDTTGGFFTANIFTSPLKKYQLSSEIGVNVSQGLPGPFINANLKIRNVFKGLESMTLSGKFGVEGVASATEQSNVYSSVEYGTNLSLVFPQFLFPLSSKVKSRLGPYNPRTTLTAGLNYTDRPEYLRNNINMRIDYSWQKSTKRQFTFTPGDFSFIDSQVSNAFDSLLNVFAANGNNLRNSFLPSFVSSSSAAIVYNFNNYGNNQNNSSYLRLFVENGGLLLNFFKQEPFGKNLEYYQWIKLSADYRSVKPIKQSSLAYRIHVGVAYATGANETLPYEKFFFAGGSNSLRAWRPRRLGPGSYRQTDENGNVITSFEQPGDIILESSIEYRHKIFGFVNGAAFLDFGNVWTIREDQNRPGSQFKAGSFLNDIAIGAGYGLRLDFSFLILRFDASVKMYDPSRSATGAFIWQKDYPLEKYPARNEITLNIGIGHPF